MPFYIELPADEYGNTALPMAVIEGRMTARDERYPEQLSLLIDSPPELVPWSGYSAGMYGGYAETDGPARTLTREEHREIIAGLGQARRVRRGA